MKTTIVETTEYNKQTLEAILRRTLGLPDDAKFNWEIKLVSRGQGMHEYDTREFGCVKIAITKEIEPKLEDMDWGKNQYPYER